MTLFPAAPEGLPDGSIPAAMLARFPTLIGNRKSARINNLRRIAMGSKVLYKQSVLIFKNKGTLNFAGTPVFFLTINRPEWES